MLNELEKLKEIYESYLVVLKNDSYHSDLEFQISTIKINLVEEFLFEIERILNSSK